MTNPCCVRSHSSDSEMGNGPDTGNSSANTADTSKPHWTKSAVELAEEIRSSRRSPSDVAKSCLSRIAQREALIGAWAYHDADQILQQASALDNLSGDLPLLGLPIGVKDIFDTADMPTAYGSPLYADHSPTADADVVSRLRMAGALIVGKTVTTEFAYLHPGKTVNPHNPLHSPGGSSSGSAAAVADGMVALALGSQTGGSTIRPSAYCGIVGYKPTYDLIGKAGMHALAPSMDTVGLHARCVADIALIWRVLCSRQQPSTRSETTARRIFYFPGPHAAAHADNDARRSLEAASDVLRAAGFAIEPLDESQDDFGQLGEAQRLVMAREAAQALGREHQLHKESLSEAMLRLLDAGDRVTDKDYRKALALGARGRFAWSRLLGHDSLVMTFSAPGEAPLLAAGTGNSIFNRSWTLMGVPCVTLPFGCGTGARLPLGIQFIAGPDQDATLLSTASLVERAFAPFNAGHQSGLA
jgi:Asp-tRNA(Asn)/Glu-tRNA(Gln) amidotransferase A subunit family amidase